MIKCCDLEWRGFFYSDSFQGLWLSNAPIAMNDITVSHMMYVLCNYGACKIQCVIITCTFL